MWLSFPIVGLVVFVLVMCAAYIAKLLRDKYTLTRGGSPVNLQETIPSSAGDRWKLGIFFTAGTWFEILIFSYFGLLALIQTVRLCDVAVDGILVFGAKGVVGLALFLPLRRKVRTEQVKRADRAFGL